MSQTLAFLMPGEHVMPPDFSCTFAADGSGREAVHVTGELDIATAPWLEQTLLHVERRARLVVLDLSGLTFIDSSGVHVIHDAAVRAGRAHHHLLRLRGCSQVEWMLSFAGALDICDAAASDATDPTLTHSDPARPTSSPPAERSPTLMSPSATFAQLAARQRVQRIEQRLRSDGVQRR